MMSGPRRQIQEVDQRFTKMVDLIFRQTKGQSKTVMVVR